MTPFEGLLTFFAILAVGFLGLVIVGCVILHMYANQAR
jgi:hypothetical protein